MGNVCKTSAVIVTILAVIGSFILAKSLGFVGFLAGALSAFLFFLILFGIGTIIDNQQDIYDVVNANEARLKMLDEEIKAMTKGE